MYPRAIGTSSLPKPPKAPSTAESNGVIWETMILNDSFWVGSVSSVAYGR